jgi:FKBP-type peptidyl-prolyl cis-trans isomerase FkpA
LSIFKTIAFPLIFRMIFFLSLVYLVSCRETPEKKPSGANTPWMNDSVVTYNRQVVKEEIQEIDDFIVRYHWEMQKTPTGMRFMKYKNGDGPNARQGDIVTIKFKINLLNGDLVYHSDSTSPFAVEIGKRKVISGLEEGVMLMNKGSRAKLIVPSHLAYGLLGDMSTIPAGAALVMDVELCGITPLKK